MSDLKRQVKIKTGIVKRLRKELAMYEKEKVQNDKRVEDMRASGADTYDVGQAVSLMKHVFLLLLFPSHSQDALDQLHRRESLTSQP